VIRRFERPYGSPNRLRWATCIAHAVARPEATEKRRGCRTRTNERVTGRSRRLGGEGPTGEGAQRTPPRQEVLRGSLGTEVADIGWPALGTWFKGRPDAGPAVAVAVGQFESAGTDSRQRCRPRRPNPYANANKTKSKTTAGAAGPPTANIRMLTTMKNRPPNPKYAAANQAATAPIRRTITPVLVEQVRNLDWASRLRPVVGSSPRGRRSRIGSEHPRSASRGSAMSHRSQRRGRGSPRSRWSPWPTPDGTS